MASSSNLTFTFDVRGGNWEVIEASFDRMHEKVTKFSKKQLSQKDGETHFTIFADSDPKDKITYYNHLEGFGHAFSILTGDLNIKNDIFNCGGTGNDRCFDCVNLLRVRQQK